RLESLRAVVSDDPEQSKRAEEAAQLARDRIAQASKTLDTFRQTGSLDAVQRMRTGRGRQLMDQFPKKMAEMLSVENARLASYADAAARGRRNGIAIFGIITAVDFLVLSGAFFFIYRYATLRDRAEEMLRKNLALQQAILDNAGSMIITGDPDGVVQIFNRTAERKLGWRAADVVGKIDWPWVDRDEVAARNQVLSRELG